MLGLDFSRNQKLALVALVGICAIALSVIFAHNAMGTAPGDVEVREPGSESGTRVIATDSDPVPSAGAQNSSGGKVVFQVAGSVWKPGVYTLPEGQRVNDAINAAGGALPQADVQALNLAAKIEDGQRIFVPATQMRTTAVPMRTGAMASQPGSPAPTSSAKPSGGKLKTPGEGLVHINSADEGELQRLPGVGPSTAQKIIDYRNQIGKFTTPEQIMDVKGIGPKKFEKMRPFVSL